RPRRGWRRRKSSISSSRYSDNPRQNGTFQVDPAAILRIFGSKSAEKWPQRRFFLRFGILNEFPTQSRQSLGAWSGVRTGNFASQKAVPVPRNPMRITLLALTALFAVAAGPARADLHITRDHGGYVEEYKAKYKRVRDKGERVI